MSHVRSRALALFFPALLAAQTTGLRITVVAGEGAEHMAGARVSKALTIQVTDDVGRPVADSRVSFQLPGDGPSGVFANGLRTELAITDAVGRASVRTFQLNQIPGALSLRITVAKESARAGAIVKQYVMIPGGASAGASASHLGEKPPPAVEIFLAAEKAPAPDKLPAAGPAKPVAGTAKVSGIERPRTPQIEARSRNAVAGPAGVADTADMAVRRQPVSEATITRRNSDPRSGPTVRVSKSHKKWVLLAILAAGGTAGAFAGRTMVSGAGSGAAAAAASTVASSSVSVSIGAPTINVGHP